MVEIGPSGLRRHRLRSPGKLLSVPLRGLLGTVTHVITRDPVAALTFDDGPHPEITPWVLENLKQYNAHATFFCVGQNVKYNPEIFRKIVAENHSVGNHSMNHLNGWKTPDDKYEADINECKALVNSDLFRPPYGRISISQYKKLRKNFRIYS